jgi:cytochrome c553
LAGDVETVSRNCTWCHGALGRGYSTAPRLAGQRHEYIMSQLYDFRTHARDNPFSQQYMWGATANLGPQTARDLAAYFSTLPPTPANDGDRALVEIGRDIYLEGIPDYDIASCAACHGPNAEGVRQIPRLGGLPHDGPHSPLRPSSKHRGAGLTVPAGASRSRRHSPATQS